MHEPKVRCNHHVSGATDADNTHPKSWQRLTARTVRADHTSHEEENNNPFPALRAPKPSPPPERGTHPMTQKKAAASLAPQATPTSLKDITEYRLNLCFTPRAHKTDSSPLQQQGQDPTYPTEVPKHSGEERRSRWIEQGAQTPAEVGAMALKQQSSMSSVARMSPPPLDIASSFRDGTANIIKAVHTMDAHLRRPALVRDTDLDGRNLVDSPRQHDLETDDALVECVPPSTTAKGASDEYDYYSYTPDDLVVKAAQCYEQWRQCIMSNSPDSSVDDGHLTGISASDDWGRPTAANSEAGAVVRRSHLTSDTALQSTETPSSLARKSVVIHVPHTPAHDTRGFSISHRGSDPPQENSFLSLAKTRNKYDSRYVDGTRSPALSAETAMHGLTSGRKERHGDTDSTITVEVRSPSLSMRLHASPTVQDPSPHVTQPATTVSRSARPLDEKASKQLTVETIAGMTRSTQGTRAWSTTLPLTQQGHQRSETHSLPATSPPRSDKAQGNCMKEDAQILHASAGPPPSTPIRNIDNNNTRSTVAPILVHRRLFTDESEDSEVEDADTACRDTFDASHIKEGGVTTADSTLLGSASDFGEEADEQSSPASPAHTSECQCATMIMPTNGGDCFLETLIELSSSSSSTSSEDYKDEAKGVEFVGDETPCRTEVDYDQPECISSNRDAAPCDAIRENLSVLSVPCICLQRRGVSVEKGSGNVVDCKSLIDGQVTTTPDIGSESSFYRDHPLWRKHHASVTMQYASRLLPSEQTHDELQFFLCWAQEKAERQIRLQQPQHVDDSEDSKRTASEASELVAGLGLPAAVSKVYKVVYAAARHRRSASVPGFQVQGSDDTRNSERKETFAASSNESPPIMATQSSSQPTRKKTHPPVFVAAPLSSRELTVSQVPSADVMWTLTPSAAPSRFLEWIATEADPYESLLFSPL